jgi:tetratricopeptide (TPR) repeat protein
LHNCCETQNFWDIFSVLFGIFHFSYQDLSLFQLAIREKYYKKALELEPDNANINNNYALFLKDIHKNDDQAEKHYKKALELKPDNAEINSNYAQFLFIKGEESQAQVYLDKAFNFADNQDLLVELWFYRLAHCPDYRQQAIEQLDALLEMEAKSIRRDFSANIERAKEQGFEPIELLQQYADKISQ